MVNFCLDNVLDKKFVVASCGKLVADSEISFHSWNNTEKLYRYVFALIEVGKTGPPGDVVFEDVAIGAGDVLFDSRVSSTARHCCYDVFSELRCQGINPRRRFGPLVTRFNAAPRVQ